MPQILDWLAQSYRAASRTLNDSRAINCFAEIQLQDAKAKAPVAVWGAPGSSPFATLADSSTLTSDEMNGVLYVVTPQYLWQVNPDGTSSNLGAQGCSGPISIDNNGFQLVWTDGVSCFVYQPGGVSQTVLTEGQVGDTSLHAAVTGTIVSGDPLVIPLEDGTSFTTAATATVAPSPDTTIPLAAALPSPVAVGAAVQDTSLTIAMITDPNFYPSSTVTYFDGYFVFVRNGTKQFFISPLFGIGPFNGAMFASKEATSDQLLAIANSHEQLYLFGQERIEVWYDAGNPPPTFPFQRSDGALIQRGLSAIGSIVLEDNTVFFLGDDKMYYRLNGFLPERVSDHGVETQWSLYPTVADCRADSFTLFGHKMIFLTFITAQVTWVLDLSTKRWHERESWIGSSAADSIGRWRVNWAYQIYNRLLLGDSVTGQIQQLNQSVFTEFGDTLPLRLVGPPFSADRKRLFMRRFEIDMETGVGLKAGPSTVAVQYCAQGVELTSPDQLATAGPLTSLPATFSTWLFSGNVSLPDDNSPHGIWFSNQTADTAPGSGGIQIGIFNDESSDVGYQVVVRCYDVAGALIVAARYAFTSWTAWTWFGISCDTATQVLDVWLNDGTGDQELLPASLTWSSTNAVANTSGQPWHIVPSAGP